MYRSVPKACSRLAHPAPTTRSARPADVLVCSLLGRLHTSASSVDAAKDRQLDVAAVGAPAATGTRRRRALRFVGDRVECGALGGWCVLRRYTLSECGALDRSILHAVQSAARRFRVPIMRGAACHAERDARQRSGARPSAQCLALCCRAKPRAAARSRAQPHARWLLRSIREGGAAAGLLAALAEGFHACNAADEAEALPWNVVLGARRTILAVLRRAAVVGEGATTSTRQPTAWRQHSSSTSCLYRAVTDVGAYGDGLTCLIHSCRSRQPAFPAGTPLPQCTEIRMTL